MCDGMSVEVGAHHLATTESCSMQECLLLIDVVKA
jgi:hypothetical protein